MAYGAYTWWEVETGGSDTLNGGGFDTQNANMLTDLAATVANTGSPVVTSASYSFVAGDVGYWLFIQKGTNWLSGWYKIASVAGGAATLTAGIGTASVYYTNTAGKNFGMLTTNAVAGCASVASLTAGTWSIDYSQNSTARITFTDLVIGATTTQLTSAANPFGKQMTGNVIAVTSGTGFTVQRVQILSVTGTTATMDRTCGTASSTGGNGGLGGALASPGVAGSLITTGSAHGVWVQNGSYTMNVPSVNVANGKFRAPVSGVAISAEEHMFLMGYNAVRGDNPTGTTRPTFLAATGLTGTSFLVDSGTSGFNIGYLIINGANIASTYGLRASASNNQIVYVKMTNTTLGGFSGTDLSTQFFFCEFTGGTLASGNSAFEGAGFFYGCVAHDFAASGGSCGFSGNTKVVENCIAFNISGATSDGFAVLGPVAYLNCTAYNCGRHGFRIGAQYSALPIINCLSVGNGGFGFGNTTTNDPVNVIMLNCAAYNNTSGTYEQGLNGVIGFVTLTANPFVSAPTNFGLNNAAGGGAACRGVGSPTTFPSLASTLNYGDIGAVQHQDSGGGGAGQTAFAYVG